MQTLLNVGIVAFVVVLAWGFTLAGLGYVVQRCRRLIGRLLERKAAAEAAALAVPSQPMRRPAVPCNAKPG